jgi:biopolymer transport protein ExbB
MEIWDINAKELLVAGGPIMIPIICCSAVAVGIVAAKLVYFATIHMDSQNLKQRVFQYLKENRIKDAIKFCQEQKSPVAKIFEAGILKFGHSREDMKEAMEDVSLFEIPKLEKRLTALATIAHVTPLLGLLGTVTGITASFHMIQVQSNSLSPITPGDLAGGIWEALLTTIAGLMVAIPTFVAYNYLVSRVNHVVLEMERAATELLNFTSHLLESGTATPAFPKFASE